MAKLIIAIAIIGGVALAWHLGFFDKLLGAAVDSVDNAADRARDVRRDATKTRD